MKVAQHKHREGESSFRPVFRSQVPDPEMIEREEAADSEDVDEGCSAAAAMLLLPLVSEHFSALTSSYVF